jgi:hypothetical protein
MIEELETGIEGILINGVNIIKFSDDGVGLRILRLWNRLLSAPPRNSLKSNRSSFPAHGAANGMADNAWFDISAIATTLADSPVQAELACAIESIARAEII